MSNQPENPQPHEGQAPSYTPPGYNAPAVPPPYQGPPANQAPQNPYGDSNQQFQPPMYGAPQAYQNPQAYPGQQPYPNQQFQYGAYQGAPGYMGATIGPRGLSLTSMILGLASLVVGVGFFIVPQIVGIVLGHLGLRKENPQGRGFAITGLITNYLALLIWGGIYIIMIFVIAVSESGSSY
ncbi:DUF4190 domain-containing protein [Arthrobacter alpinus]|uniref:DUF4190 domain-containing protein n=1 Tax=Arthrobacter alpinus TaxID=656366 RepID=UPI001EF4CC75|nr:DUF4190 domain-containing protein [Arthrobacter alpinus]